jgi:hypothetical protein
MQRNERASQWSGALAALQWSGMETAGIDGVRLFLASDCNFAASVTRASGLGLRFKTSKFKRHLPQSSIPK